MDITEKLNVDLPYFDWLLQELSSEEGSALQEVAGRNVHWGYWEKPVGADLSPDAISKATDALTWQLINAVEPAPASKILDVGCGFGGTVGLLNANFEGVSLTGLNIDPRQLEVAKKNVKARSGNQIDFVQGNACELPFPSDSFDTVFAVECIFHFPSRDAFFREAVRVLKPGGKIVLSDFVLRLAWLPVTAVIFLLRRKALVTMYGAHIKLACRSRYKFLAKKHGLDWIVARDITKNTLPTYDAIERFAGTWKEQEALIRSANRPLALTSRMGALGYEILAFKKSAASGSRAI